MNDLTFLRQAIQLANKYSEAGRAGPFGAVIVRNGEVVGRGWNQVVETLDPTAHAEVLAIRDAGRSLGTHILEDCTLYSSCEPCPMCLAAIYWARIPRVVFAADGTAAQAAGFDDTTIALELSLDWPNRTLQSQQALKEEGEAVLEAWMKNPNKIEY